MRAYTTYTIRNHRCHLIKNDCIALQYLYVFTLHSTMKTIRNLILINITPVKCPLNSVFKRYKPNTQLPVTESYFHITLKVNAISHFVISEPE